MSPPGVTSPAQRHRARGPPCAVWRSPTGCHACSTDGSDSDTARERDKPRDREATSSVPLLHADVTSSAEGGSSP